MNFEKYLRHYNEGAIKVLDSEIPLSDYITIDLSVTNDDLDHIDLTSPDECQAYVEKVLGNNKQVAYGGYLEKRGLYAKAARFRAKGERDIHLGMDFWCKAGTKVVVPIDGQVHSFANNSDFGNYGPTIILKHKWQAKSFYTLYGHLSIESLKDLQEGRQFEKGTVLGTLGTPDINVNYAPHLHFQIVLDIEDHYGDYPGVCSQNDLDFFKKNCPNPNLLLKVIS
ncbi:peptidoglycan DD-metalloendopeptidase family protein [Flagellimonas allohymeniacidonis]|uniref:Peptidase M23 n=1 Tax=Flagellimonas allohymeniacidonis TaxID=2517819 RepID=A0A4Q8QHU0_9FLAO|nr:peptidoglycan DD-metalloendopeptidase family protein [Allomuricauda hymeniacidonis]TAI49367.1 peptidase M23 [Allomuricauda hymeniacidonis]